MINHADYTKDDSLSDSLLKHQILLMMLVPTLAKSQIEIINKNNTELRGVISEFLDDNPNYSLTKKMQNRINVFKNKVKRLRGDAINDAYEQLIKDLQQYAELEQEYTHNVIEYHTEEEADKKSPAFIARILKYDHVLGETIKQIYENLAEKDVDRITSKVIDDIKSIDTKRDTINDIFKSDQGPVKQTDRFINNPARNSGTTRTILNAIENSVRLAMYEKSNIDEVLYVAVLDSKTSDICRSRAYKKYPVNEAPALPAHMNCRSHYEPVVKGFNQKKIEYSTWFAEQPAGFQRFVLGDASYEKYKSGKLKVNRFTVNPRKSITLEELFDFKKL